MLADSSGSGGAALGLMILVGMYFVPTIVAVIRKVPNIGSVIVINLFLGWSVIGWIVALAMAARSVPPPHQIIIQQSQGGPSHGYQGPPQGY